jgi:hypothetical protein
MPASAPPSSGLCDATAGQKNEISICTTGTVRLTGLNVEARVPIAECLPSDNLNGIYMAGGGGNLKATNVVVNGASTTLAGYKGCQDGLAVNIEEGQAVLKKTTVEGYQKNGPTASGSGSTLTMISSTVTGEGPSPEIAQNGIQIGFGAKGIIKTTTVTGNECNVASCGASGEQASGVLFYEAASGSSVTNSKIENNDDGVYYASASATVPATPDVTFTKDFLTSNRYEAADLEEGNSTLKSVTINGSGRVGVQLNQYEGQTSAVTASSTGTKISGQSEASIKVESDKKAGDIAGKFSFAGGTAAAPVLINNSNNFLVTF